MVTLAVKEFEINPHKSIYVGDKDCDVELGKKFGGTTFLVNNGQYQTTSNPDFVVKNLLEVADILESRLNDQ